MSIYDKASLVLIPSGTKTSKVYSQVPTNGDGDFTFSRSTAATRVNASGNIEKETQNLLLQSNQFDTTWFTNGPTLVGNQSGYDGSSDAWQITKSSAIAYAYIAQYISSGGVQTASFYAKAGSLSRIGILVGGGDNPYVSYDLSSGTILAQRASVIDSTMTDVGGGWYRCTMTFNTTIIDLNIYPDWDQTNTGNLYLQDIQLEQGLVARDYIETTTTAIYGGITDNVPRLDYQGSCPALLLEPQRTNLLHYGTPSAFVGSATTNYWYGPTGSVNETIGVDGYQSATQYENISSGPTDYMYYKDLPVTSGSTYTLSGYVKLGTATNACIVVNNTSAWDSVTNGGVSLTAAAGYDEWKRFEITFTAPSTNKVNIHIGYHQETGITAQSTGTFFVDSFQLEQGSYATSYIPTYGSAVTRNAEATGVVDVSSLGVTTGYTLFYELGDFNASALSTWVRQNTSNGSAIEAYGSTMIVWRDGGVAYPFGHGDAGVGSNTKKAITYDGVNIKAYSDGVLRGTYAADKNRWDNLTNFDMNNGSLQMVNWEQVIILPTALTDQEAIDLTTI